MAALVSGHNTHTHNPLSDTTALHFDGHKANFHSDFQPISILSGHCLVSFMLRHYYFLLDISYLLQAKELTIRY
jgi:hypothetical protein